MCFIIPKLMMLARLTENTTGSSHAQAADMERVRRWWHDTGPDGLRRRALPTMFIAMAASVVLCSVAAMAALGGAGAYAVQAARVLDECAAACDAAGNDSVTSINLKNHVIAINTSADTALSVQSMCEALPFIAARNMSLPRPCCLLPTDTSAMCVCLPCLPRLTTQALPMPPCK